MKRRSIKQVITDALRLLVRDIKNIKWAVLILIIYYIFSKKVLNSMCPLVALTGYPCPGCGLTRAGFSVLRLDFASAWEFHPFIYPIIFLLVFYIVNRYIRQKKNTKIISWLTALVVVLMVVFYIYRMYLYFPGEPPMSYYRYNVISRLASFWNSYKL